MPTRPWPPIDVTRFAIEGLTSKGVNWANIFWCEGVFPGTPSVTNCRTAAQTVYGYYNNRFMALLGNDATMERCVANWYGTQPTQITGDYLHSQAGGSSNPTEVDSLTAAVSWTFGATWRGGKPRTYLPALPTEAFSDSNQLDAAFISDVEAAATAFVGDLAAMSGSGLAHATLILVSFFSGNAPRPVAQKFPITGNIVHPRIDSQRRRLGRERT